MNEQADLRIRAMAPDEIAVVSRDRSRYDALVRDVFRDEGVAVSLGEGAGKNVELTAIPPGK